MQPLSRTVGQLREMLAQYDDTERITFVDGWGDILYFVPVEQGRLYQAARTEDCFVLAEGEMSLDHDNNDPCYADTLIVELLPF